MKGGGVIFTVARGPVPRDRWSARAWRGTGPRPTVNGGVFFTESMGRSNDGEGQALALR